MSAPTSQPEGLDRETMIVAGVVLLGAIMSILDTTVVNVAIDHLAGAFHSSLTTIQWVITGYTLALAAVIPLSGWAADRFGTKRIYIWSLVMFTLGSVLSGLAWSAGSLILFRVLQGFGGGMIMPSVMTIMTRKAGPHRMGRVMGVLGVPMLHRADPGPDPRRLAGRRCVLALDLLHQPADRDRRVHPRPDRARARSAPARTPARLARHAAAVTRTGGVHLRSRRVLDLRVRLGALVGSDARRRRADRGLVHPQLARSRTRSSTCARSRTREPERRRARSCCSRSRCSARCCWFPLYYQTVRGASALQAGLLVAPGGFGAMLLMPVAGRLTDRYGPTWLPVTGLPLVAIGLIPFVFVGAHTSYVVLCCANFVQGLGMGLAMMPNMTAAMQAVPAAAIARTSTAMNIIRQAGASIGTAVLSVILASAITSNLTGILGSRASGSRSGGIAVLQHLPANRPRRRRAAARRRVLLHVPVGAGADPRGTDPGRRDGAVGLAPPAHHARPGQPGRTGITSSRRSATGPRPAADSLQR